MVRKVRSMQHINRRLTEDERRQHEQIQAGAEQDFPPKHQSPRKSSLPGLPAQIRAAREARGLTWYALAKLAGVPNQNTIRDIESGADAKLSNVQAVAAALGLRLELVESTA
jgi:ribosome-binding protein aMBF1 (putative translation factor)